MASVVGLTLVKVFTYRGDSAEEWSNQYWLSGAIPADTAAWDALRDALIATEKTVFPATVKYVRAYGYDSDVANASAVYVHDYGLSGASGTCTVGTGDKQAPGDAAVMVAWKTSRLNEDGKRIWLRKYFHGALIENATIDTISSEQYAAGNTFATKLRDGTFLDGRTLRSKSHAETLLSSKVGGYVTTRTLKRRGKRPGS